MLKDKGRKIRAIVLLSGGLDSAVALYWARSKGFLVETLTMNYFLRGRRETETARELARFNHVKHREINLDFLKEIEDLEIGSNPSLSRAESSYIPSRNIIFYGIASSFAEVSNSRFIVGGHNKDDIKNFPDSSLKFFRLFNSATKTGLLSGARTGRVIVPLAELSKAEVIKLGSKLGVPFELTWSCYKSSRKPCGKCHSCTLRRTAFQTARIPDPLESLGKKRANGYLIAQAFDSNQCEMNS
jgi:7-cyano-7-deazaguanine synthase